MATKLDEKALFTGAGGQQRHGEVRSVDQRECFYCGKRGHIKRDCHQKMRDDEERSGQAKRTTGERAEQANLMLGVRSGRYEQAASGRGDEWGVRAVALSARTELANIVEQGSWVLDSGATNHITNDYKRLINVRKTDDGTVITMANGRKEIVSAVGDVVLSELDGLKLDRIILKDVLCVPMAEYNLLSVACAVSKGANFEFGAESCKVSKGNVVIAEARVHNGIYCLRAKKRVGWSFKGFKGGLLAHGNREAESKVQGKRGVRSIIERERSIVIFEDEDEDVSVMIKKQGEAARELEVSAKKLEMVPEQLEGSSPEMEASGEESGEATEKRGGTARYPSRPRRGPSEWWKSTEARAPDTVGVVGAVGATTEAVGAMGAEDAIETISSAEVEPKGLHDDG
jgi:hypothetical protein